MSNPLESKNFGLKIYNRFPPKYREDDVSQNYALQRYLESLSDGGFSPIIDDVNGIPNFTDPDKVDAKFLPVLFEQYGLPVFNGIPESYLRYLLPRLSEAYIQKGSVTSIEFVTSAISGVKVNLEVNGEIIDIKFEMDFNLDSDGYFPDVEQFGRIIDKFLPFYFDRNLIYVYVFSENQVLNTYEESEMEVQDIKLESCGFPSYRSKIPTMTNDPEKVLNSTFILNPVPEGDIVDAFVDVIKYSYLDKINTVNEEDVIDNIIMEEKRPVKLVEDITERSTTLYDETPQLWARGKKIIGSSVMGQAIVGKMILGKNEDFADVVQEDIKYSPFEESAGFLQFIDTNTNDETYLLNDNFYTNANGDHMEFSYDVITINGEQTTIYHY